MKTLIVYATTEGHTRKVARFMSDVLSEAGHVVTIADAVDKPPVPDDFDAILIGASIHMHKYQSAITDYVKRHASSLNKKPGAFYSVCLAVASEIEEEHLEAEKITKEFLSQTGWKPILTKQIAGALKFTEYDFFKRIIMKMISKREGRTTDTTKDHEYTDWNEVKRFVNDFADKAAKKEYLNYQ
jgi:menaquinone-dependent protoporphyrinogen oxidase